jgi:hypothetical protein
MVRRLLDTNSPSLPDQTTDVDTAGECVDEDDNLITYDIDDPSLHVDVEWGGDVTTALDRVEEDSQPQVSIPPTPDSPAAPRASALSRTSTPQVSIPPTPDSSAAPHASASHASTQPCASARPRASAQLRSQTSNTAAGLTTRAAARASALASASASNTSGEQ